MNKLIRLITRLLSLTIILLALVVVGLRIGLANIDLFKSDIQSWLARDVAPGIKFADIQGGWNQLNPILKLTNATILLPNRDQTTAIDNLSVELNIWKSLSIGSPVVGEVSGNISKLSLRKDSSQQWWLNDLVLSGDDREKSGSDIKQLIAQFPHYIHLNINQLIVFDQTNNEKYLIDNIEIDTQQRGGSHFMQLNANLPDVLGGNFKFKSIVSQDSRVGYFISDRLEIDRIASLLDINIGGIQQGEIGGEVWLNFVKNRTLTMNGNISIRNGLIQPHKGGELLPFSLDSQLSIYQGDNRWNISNRFKSLSVNYLPLQGFGSEFSLVMDGGKMTAVEGLIEGFALSNLRALDDQLIPANIVNALNKSELSGRLNNLWFSVDPNEIDNIRLMTDVVNITSKPVNGIPGVNGVNASFTYGNQNAGLQMNSSQMALDFNGQFRAPLEIDEFKLKADISLLEDSLLLSVPNFEAANGDINTSGRLWLEADKAGKPFLYLRANFEDGNGSSTSKYLPVKIMPKKVVSWLDHGIKAVDVSNGNLLYHGRLEDIQSLTKNNSGELMVDFEVDNTRVLFDSNWPLARNGKGRVLFHNMGMNIDLEKVGFKSIDDASASVSIADFKKTVVKVDVNTRTSTDTAFQTWVGTPVGKNYSSVVGKLKNAKGSVLARIGISLPIEQKKLKSHVDVKLQFNNAAVKAPAWGVELSKIEGELRVTEKTITGNGIQALFYKDPVVVDVKTDNNSDQTLIKASGLLHTQQLLNLLPDYLTQEITGSSNWDINIGIANRQPEKALAVVQINAKSDLQNTQVLFPEPFSKPENSSQNIALNISILESASIKFNVAYGSKIKARGELIQDTENAYRVSKLGVGFSTLLRPLSSKGVNVYGTLPVLPLDDWIDYYSTHIASASNEPGKAISFIDKVHLDIKSVEYYGRSFTGTELMMSRIDDGLAGTIQSSLLKGSFTLPLQHSPKNPIIADLDYIKIPPGESESRLSGLFPHNFFNLNLLSKVMSYDQVIVSDFRLDTILKDNQLTVDTLAFRHDQVFLTSSAYWKYLPRINEHRSALSLSITGKKIGQSLAALGLGDTMKDGEINMDGRIQWSGELLSIDWDSLMGDARLEISKGTLKNIEPGTGRFVGLLSLNALPQRLALDFKDVMFEGMVFDKITGSYKIEGENLYTDDTKMEGTSAKVLISGKVGLRQRDYDQTMLVIPKIRQTLPVIGSLVAGSGGGWGLLLIQKLFKKAIDKSVEIEYKVTGSWDDPQVDLIKKTAKEERVPNDK